MTGNVKWWDECKGFGFVTGTDGKDAFVHHSEISGRGRKNLEQGQAVEFAVENDQRGLRATHVMPK